MANVKTAKEALDKCITTFQFAKTALSNSLTTTEFAVSERTLVNKMKKVEETLHELNMAHTSWVSKSEFDDATLAAEKYSPSWLELIWQEVSTLQDKVDDRLSKHSAEIAPPIQTNKHKLIILSGQMETLQQDIRSKINELESEMEISANSTSETTTSASSKMSSGSIKACICCQR